MLHTKDHYSTAELTAVHDGNFTRAQIYADTAAARNVAG
jgi:hypothetical protein